MGLIISIFKTVRFMTTTLPTYPESERHTLEYLIRANHTNISVIHQSGTPNMFLQVTLGASSFPLPADINSTSPLYTC